MLIKYETENVNVGKVTKVIFLPTDVKESDPNHLDLGDTPMIYPENIPGMDAVLKVNLLSRVLFYDYYAPETIETKIQALEKENADLKAQLAEAQAATLELHESQTMQDAKIAEANNATLELYELIAQGGTV